jgi:hypothetical protein
MCFAMMLQTPPLRCQRPLTAINFDPSTAGRRCGASTVDGYPPPA